MLTFQMRYTKKVSVWPVGLVGKLRYESPLLSERTGLVVGWFTAFKRGRLYATDMAGFSINVRLIIENPTVEFNSSIPRGELESNFLQQLIGGVSELEPRANNCTEVGTMQSIYVRRS
jgi:galactosylgalactosylxylosylprotein 3-beta-glucuronosyltransferase 3